MLFVFSKMVTEKCLPLCPIQQTLNQLNWMNSLKRIGCTTYIYIQICLWIDLLFIGWSWTAWKGNIHMEISILWGNFILYQKGSWRLQLIHWSINSHILSHPDTQIIRVPKWEIEECEEMWELSLGIHYFICLFIALSIQATNTQ